jgi:hypothetical protein
VSQTVSASPQFDAECAAYALDWTQRFGMTSAGITAVSGCYQADDGSWFFPTGPDDPRLVERDRLTPEEALETDLLRADLLHQLDMMGPTLPGYLVESIQSWYSPTRRPLYGHFDPSAATNGVQNQYGDALMQFISAPSAWQLKEYVLWWGNSRVSALPYSVSANFPAPVYAAIQGQLRLDWWPFPWDLADPLTLNAYLKWKASTSA